MRKTIKDVAASAGVSIATVSRVINKAENVSLEIEKKVLNAIDELGYKPNSIARSLKNKRTMTIGFIMSDLSVSFFSYMIRVIEERFRDQGYTVIVSNTYEIVEVEKRAIQVMAERQVDAIVISSSGRNEDYLYDIQKHGVPVIFVDRKPKQHKFPTVVVDKKKGIQMLLEHLTQMHHRNIAFISGDRLLATNYDRFQGINSFIYEKNLPEDTVKCYFGSFSEEFGRNTIQQILAESNPSTAIITGSIAIATGVMMYCKENNINIPNDLSLVCFGDFPHGKLLSPLLTYIDDKKFEIGENVADMLEKIFSGQALEKKVRLLEPTLIFGETAGVKNMEL